jgi:alkaline phosphatase
MSLVLAAAVVLALGYSACRALQVSSASSGKAKNIMLLVGDGMGPSQFGAAWFYSNRILGRDLRMVEVMNAGHTAYLLNDTADAIVTESAAAAGQIATGRRMTTATVSMAADGKTPVQTIMEIAKNRGLAAGLVTTAGITDATPAAFAAHVPHRSDELSVAEQELRIGVDVLMGGGKQFFLPEISAGRRKDGRNLLDEAEAAGYAVIGDAEELKAATGLKILGLFTMGDMAYEIDRASTTEPSLADMTAKALTVLSRNPKGFFAMIEGGRIDHAAHRNDAAGTIRDMLAFDDAIGVVVDFARKNPNTLLIVTADHETAGMALCGTSEANAGIALTAIQKANASFEMISGELGRTPTAQAIQEGVREHLGIQITEDEATRVANAAVRKLDSGADSYAYLPTLAVVLRPYLGVGWVGRGHTACPLYAFGMGPGSERIKGLLHNTQLFEIMKAAVE